MATNLTEEEKEFFESYKEEYKKHFDQLLDKYGIEKRKKEHLSKRILFFYEALKHLGDPKFEKRLKEVLYELHRLNVPLRQLLSRSFFKLIEDFLTYLKNKKEFSLQKVKALTEKLEKILKISDEVFAKYMEELRQSTESKGEVNPSEQSKIINYLRKLNPVTITLLGFYKEFPVYCKTHVEKFTDLFVKVAACPYKIFVPDTKVYIKLGNSQKGILAKIVNADKEQLILAPIRFEEIPSIKSVRVFPSSEIDVVLETESGKLYGFLSYISVGELGVIVGNIDGLKEGQKVKVYFKLPTGEVCTTAKVVKIKKLHGGYKVELVLDLTRELDQIISRYVLERQREIMKDIRL